MDTPPDTRTADERRLDADGTFLGRCKCGATQRMRPIKTNAPKCDACGNRVWDRPMAQVEEPVSGTAILGGVLVALGVLLLLGNRSGFMPTVPFAGFVVTGVGALMLHAGKRSK